MGGLACLCFSTLANNLISHLQTVLQIVDFARVVFCGLRLGSGLGAIARRALDSFYAKELSRATARAHAMWVVSLG